MKSAVERHQEAIAEKDRGMPLPMLAVMSPGTYKVLKAQMDKLQPSSADVLEQMWRDGEAYVKKGKLHIRAGYESKLLAFKFKEE